MLRSGMLKLYFQLPQEGRRRYYKEMLPLLTRTKQEVMGDRDDDCYYLVYIGTKPHARGKGYAGKLLRHMMRKVCHHPLNWSPLNTSPFSFSFYNRLRALTMSIGRR